MASRIVTLFGEEEIIPEDLSVAPIVVNMPGEKDLTGMAILNGWMPEKHYYSIGEVAKLFGVRTSHIRFWTTEFSLKVRTTRKGDRLFSPDAIQELRGIYHLIKERGFTIAGARSHLQHTSTLPETLDLRQSLLRLRNQLIAIRNELL